MNYQSIDLSHLETIIPSNKVDIYKLLQLETNASLYFETKFLINQFEGENESNRYRICYLTSTWRIEF